LQPSPGAQHLLDGQGNGAPDGGKPVQPLGAFPLSQVRDLLLVRGHSPCRAAVRADAERVRVLLLEQIGDLQQFLGNRLVVPCLHD
jgi:hypothetical protein